MNLYKSDKSRFIIGFIFIIIIYTWYYIYFAENKNTAQIPSNLRYIITFSATLAVYFVGTFHLGKLKDTWMSSLWHFIHITGLGIIGTMGLYNMFIHEISLNARHFAGGIQEMLISPVLYFAMGLLNRTFKTQEN